MTNNFIDSLIQKHLLISNNCFYYVILWTCTILFFVMTLVLRRLQIQVLKISKTNILQIITTSVSFTTAFHIAFFLCLTVTKAFCDIIKIFRAVTSKKFKNMMWNIILRIAISSSPSTILKNQWFLTCVW